VIGDGMVRNDALVNGESPPLATRVCQNAAGAVEHKKLEPPTKKSSGRRD